MKSMKCKYSNCFRKIQIQIHVHVNINDRNNNNWNDWSNKEPMTLPQIWLKYALWFWRE